MEVNTIFNGHKGIIWNFSILKDNKGLISCSGDMTVIFWNIDGTINKKINEKGIPKYISVIDNVAIIYCEAFSKRMKSYFISYDINTCEELNKIELEKKITAFNTINNMMITGDDEGYLKLLTLNDGSIINSVKIHDNIIKSIVINSKNDNILTGSTDKTSKILDLDLNVLNILQSNSPINCAVFYAKDKKVLLGGGIEAMLVAMAKSETNDLKIKMFNIKSQKLVKQFTSHFGPIRHIDVFNKNFVTAGQDGIAKFHSFEKFDSSLETINTEDMITVVKDSKKIVQHNVVGMNNVQKPLYFIESTNNCKEDEIIEPIKRTIKLSNLPQSVNEDMLYEQFDIFGKIDGRIKIVRLERDTIAYINFSDKDNALRAYNNKIEERFILFNSVVSVQLIEGRYYK